MFSGLFDELEDVVDSVDASGYASKKSTATFTYIVDEERSACGYAGLENQGATCYLNSLIQSLYMTPEVRSLVLQFSFESRTRKVIPLKLQRLFADLLATHKRSVSTVDLTKGFGWQSSDSRVQHDVHEFIRVLMDYLEQSLEGTSYAGKIESLFRGVQANYIVCSECGYRSEREEVFLDFAANVRGLESLEAGIEKYLDAEILDGDNKYHCDRCNAKVRALKGIRLQSLPTILVVSMMRFEYDWNRDCRIKLDHAYSFPEVLDLAKHLPTEDPQDCIYELYSVIIHLGGAYGGHYHAYIRDVYRPQAEDETDIKNSPWFDFDDCRVNPITASRIRSQFGGKSECAYMLFYRKKSAPLPDVSGVNIDAIPESIRTEIHNENIEFHKSRAEAEAKANKIDISVVLSHQFKIESKSSASESPQRQLMLEKGTDKPSIQDAFFFQVDKRWTIQELIDHLIQQELPVQQGWRVDEVRLQGQRAKIVPLEHKADTNLLAARFHNHIRIVVWDGQTIAGQPWSIYGETITLPVIWYHDEVTTSIIQIEVREHAQTTEVYEKASAACGLAHDQVIVWVLNGTGLSKLGLSGSLLDHAVNCGSRLGIERKTEEQKQSLAVHHQLNNSQNMDVFIVVHLDDFNKHLGDKCRTFTFDEKSKTYERLFSLSRHSTLKTLKSNINDFLPPGFTPSHLQLRRSLAGGGIGDALQDNDKSLRTLGVYEKDRLFLQFLQEPEPSMVIRVRYIPEGVTFSSSDDMLHEIMLHVEKSWTLLKCKQLLAEQLERPVEALRLREADTWDHPARLFMEEMETVESEHICNGDLIYVEEGKIPPKGQITLHLLLSERIKSSADGLNNYESYEPFAHPFQVTKPLGFSKVDVLSSLTLYEFKQYLCTSSFLDGRQCEPLKLRVWDGGRLLRSNKKTLKQHNVGDGRTVTVQILDQDEAELSSTSIVLQVHRRVVDTSGRFFLGEPFQLILDNNRPAIPPAFLYDTLRQISPPHQDSVIRLAKYVPSTGQWCSLEQEKPVDVAPSEKNNLPQDADQSQSISEVVCIWFEIVSLFRSSDFFFSI
eukprot:TRINITY_DN4994_c0_g1_i3.p1 TRINITY_DN4994_c0_g1~~TRINITY_DN4994_c0_g1_i3.p1  ORF type:complete len:1060 (-),score=216.65 TRINITY_DN4994_c0_g1_i3:722-3901(-)